MAPIFSPQSHVSFEFPKEIFILVTIGQPNVPKLGTFSPELGTLGAIVGTYSGLADALFSGTKQQVLGLLFAQPDCSFYMTQVIAWADRGRGAVQRELASLVQSGLVNVKTVGNQKHYQANPGSPIFEELCAIVQKTIGLAEPLRHALAPLSEQIIAAFVYGSVAKNTDTAISDIDLMLISNHISYADVFGALEEASGKLRRPVNPTILTREEYSKRLAAGESFLTRVLDRPKIWIIGGIEECSFMHP